MELRKRVKAQEREDVKPGLSTRNDADTDATSPDQKEEPVKDKRKNKARNMVVKKGVDVVKKPRRTGKLALLLQMPIEIFTEVACYMTPGDLLNLARTSVDLRELLMSKSSKRVWTAARTVQKSQIPPCPSDLSEPQYADLLFGKGCSFCPEVRTSRMLIPLRARFCKKCLEDKLEKIPRTSTVLSTRHHVQVNLQLLIPSAEVDWKGRINNEQFVVAAQLQKIKHKIEEIHCEQALQEFIQERTAVTKSIKRSQSAIERWLRNEACRKEECVEELVKSRRACIETKLLSLGYESEDFITQFDDRGWKWNKLLNQTRPLSDRVWQNIRPQLEDIIRLRREHASSQFKTIRRKKRRNEIEARFENFKPQLSAIPFGRLFSYEEFFELPLVNNTMEENDYRTPVTNERWNRITACLPKLVTESLKIFERCCVVRIIEASRPVIEDNDNETALPSLDTEVDSQLGTVDDQDEIPKCLLAATALFVYGHRCDVLSYQQMLYDKSLWCTGSGQNKYFPRPAEHRPRRDFCDMAERLIDHLKLPRDTTMSYMLACGKIFRCLICSRMSERKKSISMSWFKLVRHFCQKRESHAKMSEERTKNNIDVPLRNDHDLDDSHGPIVKRAMKTTVDMSPSFELAGRYSSLSPSWGCREVNTRAEDAITDDSDGELEDKEDNKPLEGKFCSLCKRLSEYHFENDRRGMRKHMRLCHGTDLEGHPLHPGDAVNRETA